MGDCGLTCMTSFVKIVIVHFIFPKKPELKEKWIKATGRGDDWFPTRHSAICSSHFEEHLFLPTTKSRRLFPKAAPTLKLRLVFDDTSTNAEEKFKAKKTIIKRNERKTALERYRVTLQKYKKGLKVQRMKIKRLQAVVRRYRKKVDIMKNIMNALKNENIVSEEHIWLLESDALSK